MFQHENENGNEVKPNRPTSVRILHSKRPQVKTSQVNVIG